jgi:sulfide dehydrogenase [flavocytochrome c] flavoprotein subunit
MADLSVSRRRFLAATGAAAAAVYAPALAQAAPRVVVIGGGFGGATAARAIKQASPRVSVSLVERERTFTACPFSNLVIGGLRALSAQQFGYDKVSGAGIDVIFAAATGVNRETRRVELEGGASLPYDRLIVAPGIDIRWDGLTGYNEAAATKLPHAWKAGEQTLLLRRQLEALEDGGVVVMSVPANPFRCPPGPYERASLIARYLKTQKPKSKILILDAKDTFSKQRLFQEAWKELYPDHLEWVALSKGGRVTAVDAETKTFTTEFGEHKAAVGNVIPPQRAGRAAELAGAVDQTGWCAIDPVTFESKLSPLVHVVGDATIAGGMPKSAFSANAQAKVCAGAVVELLEGRTPKPPKLINTCYSLVAPDYGISVAGVYEPVNGVLTDVPGAGGVSPAPAQRSERSQEALYAEAWFNTITAEIFG